MSSQAAYDGDDSRDIAIPRAVPLEVEHEDDLCSPTTHARPCWQVHLAAAPKRHIA